MMCIDAADLTTSIDAVNFQKVDAGRNAVKNSAVLELSVNCFLDYRYNNFLCFFQNKRGILQNINAEIAITRKVRRKLTSVNGRATGFERKTL